MRHSLPRDLVTSTRAVFALFLVAWITPLYVRLPAETPGVFKVVAVLALFIQLGLWSNALIAHWVRRSAEKHGTKEVSAVGTITAIAVIARLLLWILLLLFALDNLGIQVRALIAGLGITGLAVALAAQNILSDLFAALAIVLDKPFLVGDSISVGPENDAIAGRVESIGLKTTRIRSASGEQVVMANSELLKTRIRNYSR